MTNTGPAYDAIIAVSDKETRQALLMLRGEMLAVKTAPPSAVDACPHAWPKAAHDAIVDLTSENLALTNERDELRRELEVELSRRERVEKEHAETIRSNAMLRGHDNTKADTIAKLRADLVAATEANTSLAKQAVHAQNLENRAHNLEDTLQRREATIAKLESELAEAKRDRDKRDGWIQDVWAEIASASNKTNVVAAVREIVSGLTDARAEVERLTDELEMHRTADAQDKIDDNGPSDPSCAHCREWRKNVAAEVRASLQRGVDKWRKIGAPAPATSDAREAEDEKQLTYLRSLPNPGAYTHVDRGVVVAASAAKSTSAKAGEAWDLSAKECTCDPEVNALPPTCPKHWAENMIGVQVRWLGGLLGLHPNQEHYYPHVDQIRIAFQRVFERAARHFAEAGRREGIEAAARRCDVEATGEDITSNAEYFARRIRALSTTAEKGGAK